MKKILSIIFLLFANAILASAQDGQYKQELDILFNAFSQKDYALIKPLLDKNVKIGALPTGMNDAVVPQVLAQLPVPASYKVIRESREGDRVRVYTEYQYASGSKRAQNFVFTADKKIVDLDILGDAQVSAMSAATVTATNMPDRFETPFEVRGRILFVKAMLNGKEETFILDSGAPLLILNSHHFTADTMGGVRAQGVGGSAAMGKVHADTFDWHGITMGNFDAISMDLAHLEKACKKKFVGLIGYNLFKDYQMTYDYSRKVITFEKGANVTSAATPICTVPMKMTAHIPIIPITISGKTYKMGIDCGASTNLLYAKYLPDIKGNLGSKHRKKLSGAGKEKIKTVYAKVKRADCDKAAYIRMNFAFDDGNLEQLNAGYGLGIDGLVGYEFLKQYKTTVDYTKSEVRIYSFN